MEELEERLKDLVNDGLFQDIEEKLNIILEVMITWR